MRKPESERESGKPVSKGRNQEDRHNPFGKKSSKSDHDRFKNLFRQLCYDLTLITKQKTFHILADNATSASRSFPMICSGV
jgi:hypothetical protein